MSKKLKLGFPVKFKKAKLPTKQRLVGKYSILEPIEVKKHEIMHNLAGSRDQLSLLQVIITFGLISSNLFLMY